MNRERAEIVALRALAFIAEDEKRLSGLLSLTGLGFDDLKAAGHSPETLAGVLDYLLQDEHTLLEFCETSEIAPEEPARARMALPGGDIPHYT